MSWELKINNAWQTVGPRACLVSRRALISWCFLLVGVGIPGLSHLEWGGPFTEVGHNPSPAQ
jgi:hypothetical protein